jgi:hypothetical protein
MGGEGPGGVGGRGGGKLDGCIMHQVHISKNEKKNILLQFFLFRGGGGSPTSFLKQKLKN